MKNQYMSYAESLDFLHKMEKKTPRSYRSY